MVVWLNVAEKPSVAKEVTHILSRGQFHTSQSQSKYNPVFEFRMGSTQMIFTSVAGHLTEDDFPPQTKSWANFPLPQLFTVPVIRSVRQDLQPVKKNVEVLAKRSTHLILWLDCDREGENICFEVMDVALGANRRLDVKRAHFSALTERDLTHAVQHLQLPNKFLSEAVEARREMDLRVGAVFTRLLTVKFRDQFEGMPKLLSFGPCQFPTMGFVVKRLWERTAFVPEDFFYAVMLHGATQFTWEHHNVYDTVCAAALYEAMLECAAENSPAVTAEVNSIMNDNSNSNSVPPPPSAAPTAMQAVVTHVEHKPSRRYAPAPLNTVELQKLASHHLRMSSEKCMEVAEALYQQGYLSYPRTETDEYSFNDDELLALVSAQFENAEVGDFAQAMCRDRENRYVRPKSGGHNDKAHPPIHPIKLLPTDSGSRDHASLYTLVVRHFLACMSPPAVAAATAVTARFGEVNFHTSGQTIVDLGWLNVFTYERWGSSNVPNYQVGERFLPAEVSLRQGKTEAPPLLTETQLITLMDQQGIGTDATIAQHIKTVLDREYVAREGTVLKPTSLGVALAAACEAAGLGELVQPALRAQMELAMGDIARGVATKEAVLQAAIKMYEAYLKTMLSRLDVFEQELRRHLASTRGNTSGNHGTGGGELMVVQSSFSTCGKCNGRMELVQERNTERGNASTSGFLRCRGCNPVLLLRIPFYSAVQLSPHAQRCPICQFGVVSVTNTEKNTTYQLCPWCFSHPPAHAIADIEAMGGAGEFRCFQCIHEGCPLAKGMESVSITKCPCCNEESLRLRTNPNNGSRYLSCKKGGCFTVVLPTADEVKPMMQDKCSECGAVKLRFRFSVTQSIPGVDMEEVMCVACDGRLKQYLTIRGTPAAPTAQLHAAAASSTAYVMPTVSKRGGRGASGGTAGGRGGGARGGSRGRGSASAAGPTAGAVLCDCGVAAQQLISKKEQSAGRRFHTCGNNRTCGFFQWVDS